MLYLSSYNLSAIFVSEVLSVALRIVMSSTVNSDDEDLARHGREKKTKDYCMQLERIVYRL